MSDGSIAFKLRSEISIKSLDYSIKCILISNNDSWEDVITYSCQNKIDFLCKTTIVKAETRFDLYLEQGFDVVIVSITPWQLLWPTKGSRLVAADLIEFLIKHQNYQQILLHGFSVAGYMWGEVLDLMQNDPKKCNNIIDRIVGQVWDSLADVSELTIGAPRAMFPRNEMLQNMCQKYLEYHMKTFYKPSTQYYIRSSQLFHTNLVHSPALFFISKTDPVGSLTSNLRVKESWDSLGVKIYVKIFENSPHVEHYRKYPKEYVAELYAFLNKLNLMQNKKKMAQF
ncbi:uncharacterized protein LOC117236815 isoform X2 [Bombus vosnesenskii]|uniref:Uncharacterized protein LOC117236815 isoform X2 n=1 Tax=Bombus vosnesenskii TaxID=207650 RepID=A0A6J3KRL2_9HYME|nr:uncharacterized protein LOC117236815 isoform X2 [Bombus vosnesenskii]